MYSNCLAVREMVRRKLQHFFIRGEAMTVLLKSVGRTNTTLKGRLLVYSEEYTGKLLVVAKLI